MKQALSTAVFTFEDGSAVHWRYLSEQMRMYKKEKLYAVQIRIERGANSIDQFFETWDKPSESTALHFIKNAIKDATQL